MSISDFRGARHLNRRIHEHLRLPGCADHTSCTAHKMEVRIRLGPIYGLPVLCRLGIGSSWFLSQTSPISLHPPPQRHPKPLPSIPSISQHLQTRHPVPHYLFRSSIHIDIYLSIWRIFSNRQFVLLICRHIDQYKDISGYQISFAEASPAPHSTQCPQMCLPVPLQIEPLRYSRNNLLPSTASPVRSCSTRRSPGSIKGCCYGRRLDCHTINTLGWFHCDFMPIQIQVWKGHTAQYRGFTACKP